MTKSEKKAYKKARKEQKKEDIAKYGRNKKKRAARKAKDIAIQAAEKKLQQASTRGVKDPDTKDMPIVDRERDAMNVDGAGMYGNGKKHGSSMYKKHGSSMYKKYGSSMYKKYGSSMAHGKKHGSSMAHGNKAGALAGELRAKIAANKAARKAEKAGASMSGEKYDAKMAYNKNLSSKARLHYLENERHDKTHAHPILKHMRKM